MTSPAGWYPDPDEPGRQRWWDGELWSEHRRRAPRVQYRPHDPTRPDPGWYPAPGEPGMLRFWEGTYWLDLRLPATDAAPGGVTAGQVLGSIATQLVDSYVRPSLARPHGTPPGAGTQDARDVEDPQDSSWAGAPPTPAAWSPQAPAPPPQPVLRPENTTAHPRGWRVRRERRSHPVSNIVIGTIFLVASPFVVPATLDVARVDPGEAVVTGTVVEARGVGRDCLLTVRYVADGVAYSVTERDRKASCPDVGATAPVVYELADPTDASIGQPGWGPVALVFPAVGLASLVSGVWRLARRRRA